jgi:PAS domain S-box-containing protein
MVPTDKSKTKNNTALRKHAEKLLSERPRTERHPDDILKLVHELEVHQIELEMQNEELRRAQLAAETIQEKYADFYDFAPVGYLTLDEKGLISDLNLATSGLLGIERKSLVHEPFHRFIKTESQDVFYFHRQEVLASPTKQSCELVIKKNDGTFFDAQLYSIGVNIEGQRSIRIVLTDITKRKQAEAEAQRLLTTF